MHTAEVLRQGVMTLIRSLQLAQSGVSGSPDSSANADVEDEGALVHKMLQMAVLSPSKDTVSSHWGSTGESDSEDLECANPYTSRSADALSLLFGQDCADFLVHRMEDFAGQRLQHNNFSEFLPVRDSASSCAGCVDVIPLLFYQPLFTRHPLVVPFVWQGNEKGGTERSSSDNFRFPFASASLHPPVCMVALSCAGQFCWIAAKPQNPCKEEACCSFSVSVGSSNLVST